MDAIKLIKDDHRKVEQLFSEYESLGPRAKKSKQRVVEQIIRELRIHAEVEETIFYPAFQKASSDDDLVYEAFEEHDVMKYVLGELESFDFADPRYDARVTVCKELVQHHVEEEEKEMLPEARRVLGKERLTSLGEQMMAAKQRLMTEPQGRVSITMANDALVQERNSL